MVGAFKSADIHVADTISTYVSSRARGQGIGRGLMIALLDELRQSAVITKSRLVVNADQIPAVSLYKSLGFEISGHEEAILGDGERHTEYVMEKSLKH